MRAAPFFQSFFKFFLLEEQFQLLVKNEALLAIAAIAIIARAIGVIKLIIFLPLN